MRVRLSRVATIVVAMGFSLFTLTAPASAVPASGTTVDKSGTTLTIVASSGVANEITVSVLNGTFRVSDAQDSLVATGSCEVLDDDQVSCPVAGTTSFYVDAGDLDDTVVVNVSTLAVHVEGAAGNDTLVTTGANDTVGGGAGNDTLIAGTGNDTVSGGAGNDELIGGAGNDTLDGGGDSDSLLGGAGNDSMDGGGGDDSLGGGAGNDVIDGGSGNDRLVGDSGSDYYFGNAGDDRIDTVDGVRANDNADGGSGYDTCSADSGDTVTTCP